MEGVLALVRLYQRFTFTLNDQKHGGKPLEHESLITLMPKVQHKHAFPSDNNNTIYDYSASNHIYLDWQVCLDSCCCQISSTA